MPEGAVPDCAAWNKSVVKTELLNESGRKFLRFRVESLDQGVYLQLPGAKGPQRNLGLGYYKVVIEARAENGLDFFVRQAPKPYVAFGKGAIPSGKVWQEQSVHIHAIPTKSWEDDAPADPNNTTRLFLSFPEGATDIASVKLYKVSEEEGEKQLSQARQGRIMRPDGDCDNFFRNSRFPLGAQSGWNLSRDISLGTIALKTSVSDIGPSGSPALELSGDDPTCRARGYFGGSVCSALFAEPFMTPEPLAKDEKFTASFAYKADKDAIAALACGNLAGKVKSLETRQLKATDSWRTESFEFSAPDDATKCFFFAFDNKGGSLKLDSFQAYRGKPGRPYKSAGACEIALAPGKAELSSDRVQFPDEAANVEYAASGDLKDAILKTTVYDIYGNAKALADIELDKKSSGALPYAVFADAPLGQFRVEVHAERDGKRISPFNEIVMTRVRRPVHWNEDAPDSPFGMHCMLQKAACLKGAGMNWVRLHDSMMDYTGWAFLEPEKGKWNFRDKEIQFLRDKKLLLLGMLYTTPKWAAFNDGPESATQYAQMFRQPKDLDAFANYVRTVVSRYRDSIPEYIVGNEPWGRKADGNSLFWHKTYDPRTGGYGPNPDAIPEFVEYCKRAYQAAKGAYPELVAYGLNGLGGGGSSWGRRLYAAGFYPYCDALDYHVYIQNFTGYPGDMVETLHNSALAGVKEGGQAIDKPVIMSEGNGVSVDPNYVDASGNDKNDSVGIYKRSVTWTTPADPLALAELQCRFVLSHLRLGVKRVFLYSEHCYGSIAEKPSFASLLGADGFPTPTYAAFSNMAWQLEDMKLAQCIPIGEKAWAHIFEGRGSSVAVVAGMKTGTYGIPDSKEIETIDLFGNPLPKGAKYEGHLLYLRSGLPADKLANLLKGS